MGNQLEKWQRGEQALATERQLMKDALALLAPAEVKRKPRQAKARLIFGLDLTGSREWSLHHARIATAAMFDTIRAIGAVAVKLVYFRGADECKAGAWHEDASIVSRSMLDLSCQMGRTQIARLLRVILTEAEIVSGAVFIGDHCEDDPNELYELAEALGRCSVPLYVFHECADFDYRCVPAKPVFQRMAELSGGAYVEFRPDSGAVLKELLASLAVFSAAGAKGIKLMAAPTTSEARQLRGTLLLGAGGDRKGLKA